MEFLKVHGLGNDFVLIEGPTPSPEQVRRWCDRRTGIGADGVLRVTRIDDPEAVAGMEIWNADGSAAEMCGNGLRCAARYVFDRAWSGGKSFRIRTATGLNRAEMLDGGNVRVELGPYRVGSEVNVDGRSYTAAEVGNPHAVTFVGDAAELARVVTAEVGPSLQQHPSFPAGVNVEFAAPVRGGLAVRVWERGVGETRACGTGAAAAAAVAYHTGRAGPLSRVELAGGSLEVRLSAGVAWIRGPAIPVFIGAISG